MTKPTKKREMPNAAGGKFIDYKGKYGKKGKSYETYSKLKKEKVDRGLLVGAVAKSKQPTGKMKKDIINKAKKEVDNKKNLTKIGKTLKKNYQSRKKMKR